jgi:hypothetical protein
LQNRFTARALINPGKPLPLQKLLHSQSKYQGMTFAFVPADQFIQTKVTK